MFDQVKVVEEERAGLCCAFVMLSLFGLVCARRSIGQTPIGSDYHSLNEMRAIDDSRCLCLRDTHRVPICFLGQSNEDTDHFYLPQSLSPEG